MSLTHDGTSPEYGPTHEVVARYLDQIPRRPVPYELQATWDFLADYRANGLTIVESTFAGVHFAEVGAMVWTMSRGEVSSAERLARGDLRSDVLPSPDCSDAGCLALVRNINTRSSYWAGSLRHSDGVPTYEPPPRDTRFISPSGRRRGRYHLHVRRPRRDRIRRLRRPLLAEPPDVPVGAAMSARATLALVVVVAAGPGTGGCCFDDRACPHQVEWDTGWEVGLPADSVVYMELCYESRCSEILELSEGDCEEIVFPDPEAPAFAWTCRFGSGALLGYLDGIADPRDGDLLLLRVTDGTGRRLIDYYEGLDFQNRDGWPCENECPPYAPTLVYL